MKFSLNSFRDKIEKYDLFSVLISLFLIVNLIYGISEKSKLGGWNVDDYLYGIVTLNLGNPLHLLNWIQNVLQTGQNSPLLPSIASFIPYRLASLDTYTVLQVPILIALFWGLKQISRMLNIKSPNLISAIIITIPAFVGWSVMYHFALVSTLFVITSLSFYLSNVTFNNSTKSILFGLSIGCLSLSRSIALVYVFTIILSIVIHQIIFQLKTSKKGFFLALASAIFIAGPWWYESGSKALQYLIGFGYPAQDDSRLTFGLVNVTNRISASAQDIGLYGSIIFLVLFILFLIEIFGQVWSKLWEGEKIQNLQSDPRLFLGLVSLIGFSLLVTSTNRGTGFYLPFFAPTLLCLTWGIPKSFHESKVYNSFLCFIICCGVIFSSISVNPRINSNFHMSVPYMDNLKLAGWDVDSYSPRDANAAVARILGDSRAIVIRDDAWVNSNGIRYNMIKNGFSPHLSSAPFSVDPKWLPGLEELDDSPLFVLGYSPAPYRYGYDVVAISSFLTNHGYSKKCELVLKMDLNVIQIYGRANGKLNYLPSWCL
jgi:hypothetical protein